MLPHLAGDASHLSWVYMTIRICHDVAAKLVACMSAGVQQLSKQHRIRVAGRSSTVSAHGAMMALVCLSSLRSSAAAAVSQASISADSSKSALSTRVFCIVVKNGMHDPYLLGSPDLSRHTSSRHVSHFL